jgi:uncharacterized membrane protein
MTPARIAGHPIHPMLVGFPIGLWVFSFVCDLAFLATGAYLWTQGAFLTVGGGIIGAFAAAIPGLVDFWSLRGNAFKVAMTHMAINVLSLILFLMSFISRAIDAPYSLSLSLSAIGIVALCFGGWLGGELVFVRGIAVETTAEAPGRR